MANVALLSAYVGEMYDQVKSLNAKGGKFDGKVVVSFIKEWTKIGDVVTGGSYRKMTCQSYIRKGEPDKTTLTRTKILQRDLGSYSDMVDKKVESNDASALGPKTQWFDAVDKAMLNFVWDYWKQIAGKKAQESQLLGDIQTWQSLSEEKMLQTVVFNMDRHG